MIRTLSDPDINDIDRSILQNIEQFTWHVSRVDAVGNRPGWAFTIGLFAKFQHPEIVLFGLPEADLGLALNDIGCEVRDGRRFDADEECSGIIENNTCIFKPVHPVVMGYAHWFYEGEDFPVLQCHWQNEDRSFPWDGNYDSRQHVAQPLLFHDEVIPARAVEFLASLNEG